MGSSVRLKQVSSAENLKSGEAWANQGNTICRHKFHMSASDLHDLMYDSDTFIFFFYVLLTVHLSIILVIDKVNAQILVL